MKRTVIAFVAMVISLSSCKYNGYDSDASSSVKDSLLVDYMTYVSQFSDCSFVDWKGFSELEAGESGCRRMGHTAERQGGDPSQVNTFESRGVKRIVQENGCA